MDLDIPLYKPECLVCFLGDLYCTYTKARRVGVNVPVHT